MGVDREPTVMPQPEVDGLGDTMASELLRRGTFPLTVQDVLAALSAAGVLPHQKSYLIGEAGQIPPDTAPQLRRDLRFVVLRGEDPSEADLLISTSAVDAPATAFLQIAAWDEARGLFNYYMRLQQTWVWAGNSLSALAPGSRGNGCFDSHVNGSVVMKELKEPWVHWQSMRATILLADDNPLRQDPLYTSLLGAEDLEQVIRATVSRWTDARLANAVENGQIQHVDWLLRQLCTTTTVNLASSDIESLSVAQDPSKSLPLPLGFWLNADLLVDSDVLEIPAEFDVPTVAGQPYLDSLERYGFALTDGDAFRQPGDTFFAFVVPEPALEDNDVIEQLVATGLLTPHFVASVLMVDFPNPVFSAARSRLLRYVPQQATVPPAAGGLSDQIAEAIAHAAQGLPNTSPERQFLANWQLPESDWRAIFAGRIQEYMAAVNQRIGTQGGFDDYVRLAESRRREFRRMRLNEFTLTLPTTNIPPDAPLLQMNPDATVGTKALGASEGGGMLLPRYDPPGNLEDFDQNGRAQWSAFISGTVDAVIAGNPNNTNDSPRAQFYNLTKTDTAADAIFQDVTWIGFPRQIRISSVSNRQRWRRADASRDVQDEYCEWSVTRGADGKIRRVTFTCEPPEYWELLALSSPDTVVQLYREFVDPSVQEADLFDASGGYIRRNKWNNSTSRGAMHLVQAANTLSAEIELAAASSIRRVIQGRELTGEQELIECGLYGVAQRNSDPHIGGVVNSVARLRADLSLANPVGLYFNDLSTAGWATPDGSDPKDYWSLTRGDQEHPVRAVYEVPAGKGFVVGDIRIGGRAITFGAQIVDFISMKLTAVACRIGQSNVQPMTACVGEAQEAVDDLQLRSVGTGLAVGARL